MLRSKNGPVCLQRLVRMTRTQFPEDGVTSDEVQTECVRTPTAQQDRFIKALPGIAARRLDAVEKERLRPTDYPHLQMEATFSHEAGASRPTCFQFRIHSLRHNETPVRKVASRSKPMEKAEVSKRSKASPPAGGEST